MPAHVGAVFAAGFTMTRQESVTTFPTEVARVTRTDLALRGRVRTLAITRNYSGSNFGL